jgi:hypothetical protein
MEVSMFDVSGRISHPVHFVAKTLSQAQAVAARMRRDGYNAVRIRQDINGQLVLVG